jgi:rhodanese-related sulfurtransferase
MRFPILALVLFVVFAGGFAQTGCKKSGGAESGMVDGAKARELVKAGALLLDVRTPQEFSREHIDGAVNIPLSELDRNMSSLKKDQPIVVYCQSGNRSSQARGYLASAGFTVYDLGALYNW